MKLAVRTEPYQMGRFAAPVPRWSESLELINQHLPFARRTVQAGHRVQAAGDAFSCLKLLNTGTIKTVNLAANGRAQIVGLHFKGDWVGFDGIAPGTYACDAYALEACEVWSLSYPAILKATSQVPELMHALHCAMGHELARHSNWKFSLVTLPADRRVAEFLRFWALSLQERNLRVDQLCLPLSRADIGSYLCLTLESVSRALSRLARAGLIRFDCRGRRTIGIPSLNALGEFIENICSRAQTPAPH
jgi:CRP/FNR family transcriptional regulator, anaerobic regulatory protein